MEESLFQKLYPLLLVLFIGVIYAQEAPPTDTEDQENIESSEDPNAAPENQGVAPTEPNTSAEEAISTEDADKPKEEKKSKPPKIQKPKTQMGSLLRGVVIPGLGQTSTGLDSDTTLDRPWIFFFQ